jgi:AcrR family transcriptional regulator
MAKKNNYNSESLVDSAVVLAASGGPGAVTMQGLAAAVGAPSGSIYHRFEGRAELLAEVWLSAAERFQADWWAANESESDPGEVAASTVRWARAHRDLATILSAHRVEDFLTPEAKPSQQKRARAVRAQHERLGALAARFLGTVDRAAVQRVVFALVTIPLGAIRGPLSTGGPIGRELDDLVREAARALLTRA